MKTHLELKKST